MYKLRELENSDLKEINCWRNDPELIACFGTPYRFVSLEVEEKWFESYMQNRKNTTRCAIIDYPDNKILGLASLIAKDDLNISAEFRIMVWGGNQGKGIGSYATYTMLDHAFRNLNLHRVELYVLEVNKRAISLYEKMGFIYEGKRRESAYKDGRYMDLLIYAILQRDFLEKQTSNKLI